MILSAALKNYFAFFILETNQISFDELGSPGFYIMYHSGSNKGTNSTYGFAISMIEPDYRGFQLNFVTVSSPNQGVTAGQLYRRYKDNPSGSWSSWAQI